MGVIPFHIKPHGALYHACNHKRAEMETLIDLIIERYPKLHLLVFPSGLLHQKALEVGMQVIPESFVDRKYTHQLMLQDRSKKNAVISSSDEALEQYTFLCNGTVVAEGTKVDLVTETACIHGDNPNVLEILKSIKQNG